MAVAGQRGGIAGIGYIESLQPPRLSVFSTDLQDTQLTMMDFSMPTLNSIFPFLEAVRPESDPCWHIRRGRLLHQYEPVWAICYNRSQPDSIIFDDETVEICDTSQTILSLVPKSWNVSSRGIHEPNSKNTGFKQKLQEVCRLLVSPRCPGYVLGHDEVLGTDKKERDDNIG